MFTYLTMQGGGVRTVQVYRFRGVQEQFIPSTDSQPASGDSARETGVVGLVRWAKVQSRCACGVTSGSVRIPCVIRTGRVRSVRCGSVQCGSDRYRIYAIGKARIGIVSTRSERPVCAVPRLSGGCRVQTVALFVWLTPSRSGSVLLSVRGNHGAY